MLGTTTYIMHWKKKFDWNILVLPDQCSRTFWAFSRYRYRDTITRLNNIGSLIIKMRRSMKPSHLYNRNSHTSKTTWTLQEKVMEYLESTMKTLVFWFAGNGLAPTTNKYYDFNTTLMCSVRDNNAIGKVRNSRHTIESTGMCHFIYLFIYLSIYLFHNFIQKISDNFKGIHHYIVNLPMHCSYSIMHYCHQAKF